MSPVKELIHQVSTACRGAFDALNHTRLDDRLTKINLLLAPTDSIDKTELLQWSSHMDEYVYTEWLYVFLAAGVKRNDALLAARIVLEWMPRSPEEASIFGDQR